MALACAISARLLIEFQEIAVRLRRRRTLARLRQAGGTTNFDKIGADAHPSRIRRYEILAGWAAAAVRLESSDCSHD
jgi:hypothetical protein